jgi:hypothetical protein
VRALGARGGGWFGAPARKRARRAAGYGNRPGKPIFRMGAVGLRFLNRPPRVDEAQVFEAAAEAHQPAPIAVRWEATFQLPRLSARCA